MKSRENGSLGWRFGRTAVCLAAMGVAAVAVSQDGTEWPMPPAPEPAEHQLAPAFDMSVVSEARWMEASTPGTEHAMLNSLVGDWDVVQKLWMMGPEPMVTKMSAKTEWVLDGKHLKETLTGMMMGAPYEGMGITSYDKYNGVYSFFWADSMSTAPAISKGHASPDGGSIVAYGTMDEPMMNMRGKTFKFVLRAVNDDEHVFEIHDMHIPEPNTMVMELTYTRRK